MRGISDKKNATPRASELVCNDIIDIQMTEAVEIERQIRKVETVSDPSFAGLSVKPLRAVQTHSASKNPLFRIRIQRKGPYWVKIASANTSPESRIHKPADDNGWI